MELTLKAIACGVACHERKNVAASMPCSVDWTFVSRTNRGGFKGRPTAVAGCIKVGPWYTEKVCSPVILCPVRKLDRSFDSVVGSPSLSLDTNPSTFAD